MRNIGKPLWLVEIIAVWGYVQRNYFLTKRYFMWEVVWLTFTTVNAMSITFIGAGAAELKGGEAIDVRLLHDVPAHRGPDLELPLHDLRHPLGDGAVGAVGGDDRVHFHEPDEPGHPPARHGRLRDRLRHSPHGHRPRGRHARLRPRPRKRQLRGRRGSPGRVQHLARRVRGGRRRHAAALPGEGSAGDVYRLRAARSWSPASTTP